MTASVFVFTQIDQIPLIGLIWHPRLACWMIPGGHVEAEPPSDAALRETSEETGLAARLLSPPGPELPAAYPHPRIPRPWWIVRIPVDADSHIPGPHIHEDHQYVAWVDQPDHTAGTAELAFQWVPSDRLSELSMFTGTRMVAEYLFSTIGTDHQGARSPG